MRSHKSSTKSDKSRFIDVSRTVRRRLNMSSYPDVVQTSQYRRSRGSDEEDDDEIDEDHTSFANDDVDKEEFFLAKNSRLFSQVSSNTLKPEENVENEEKRDPTDCKVVEVKAMEIIKSVAGTSGRGVVLPSANFGIQHVPQVNIL